MNRHVGSETEDRVWTQTPSIHRGGRVLEAKWNHLKQLGTGLAQRRNGERRRARSRNRVDQILGWGGGTERRKRGEVRYLSDV